MDKRVLLVSYYAPPLINAESILVWKTARELARRFDVNIMTSDIPAGVRVDPQLELPGQIQVFVQHSASPQNPFARKAMDKAVGLFADEAYLWTKRRIASADLLDCDVIYSRSHPGASHILAHHIKSKTRKPWIAQFSDPWAKNPYHIHHSVFRKAFDRYWERKVVEDADVLIFPTKEIQAMYYETYGPSHITDKSVILPHHYTPELYQSTESETGRNEPRLRERSVTLSYFGDFYGARSPEPFIAALRQLSRTLPNHTSRAHVNFYGNIEAKFKEIVQDSPVDINVNKVPYLESLRLMTQSDILLLIDAPCENGHNPFLASKLIDYLGAGRRILGITDLNGTAADILRSGGHYVVSPHDIVGVAAAVTKCLSDPEETIMPPSEFTTLNVIGRLAEIIDTV